MTHDLPRRVTLSPEVLFRELDGEAVMLDLETERYYGLDEVGTRIWQLFAENGETEAVIAQMLAEYEVDEERLREDLAVLLGELAEAGLIHVDAEDAPSTVPAGDET